MTRKKTIQQMADATGITYDAMRARIRRRGIAAVYEMEQSLRDMVATMEPREAVEFLLRVCENLGAACDERSSRKDLAYLSPTHRKIYLKLESAKGGVVSQQSLHDFIYSDRINDPPSIQSM